MIPVVDGQRARLVVSLVNDAFTRRRGLLSETDDLVENQIPEGIVPLSRDHGLFLFYTVANDHGMKSSRLYARAKGLFLERRDLFEPSGLLETHIGPEDPQLMQVIGTRLGVRYPREAAKTWYLNSARLLEKFGGDPRNLFSSTPDARALMTEITAFRGYGPKTGGMLLRAVIGVGFADARGIEDVLVPVDVHDARITFQTGILRLPSQLEEHGVDYHAHAAQVQKVLLNACNSLGLQWLDVDRGLWLIGSRGCVQKRCALCPLYDLCIVGRRQSALQNCVQGPLGPGPA